MHTKHDIQRLLSAAGTRPNKRLGQNFLIDLNLMRLFVDLAQPGSDDVVLEVGCGTGSLTQALAARAGAVIVAEYDATLAGIARVELASFAQVQLFNLDILETKHRLAPPVTAAIQQARRTHGGRFLLVANLPYHVSCPVMLNLVIGEPRADAMVITVQKEVADRMVAPVGSPDYGILSILLAATGVTERVRLLKPTVFWPAPQVASAMVTYRHDPVRATRIVNRETLVATVSLFMQHRRKMLKATAKTASGSWDAVNWSAVFAAAGIEPTLRPEQVTTDQFVTLANGVTTALQRT
jgi:16S rRNA (adenine1518-N6/adenine1519-N6)-dimethyltransferase